MKRAIFLCRVMRRVGARDLHGEIPCNRRVGRPTGPSHSLPGVVVSLYSMHNMKSPQRCSWPKSELDIQYHDKEWGLPQHEDQVLFEFLVLEGAQAGLSWSTILNKRLNYRAAFDNFDPAKVARYSERKRAQ